MKAKAAIVGIIILANVLLCINLLKSDSRPWTFDGLTHLSNIAQYNVALRDGDMPVRWLSGSANYGMPFGIFAHQTLLYLGAGMLFAIKDVLTVGNLIILIFGILGTGLYYLFLREYTDRWSALIGALFFNFAPYRIINLYIRGAIPEFMVSSLLPLILICMKRWIEEEKSGYYFGFIFSLFLLWLTHPISAISYGLIMAGYFLFLLLKRKDKVRVIIKTIIAGLWSVGMAAFYLIPLKLEFKYLYAGLSKNVLVKNSFLDWSNFIYPERYYFTNVGISKSYYLQIGIVETLIIIVGLGYGIGSLIKKKKTNGMVIGAAGLAIIYVFLMSSLATPLFEKVNVLGNLQHQWRMMSGLIFLSPAIAALGLTKIKSKLKYVLGALLVAVVLILRLPRLWPMSYVASSNSDYYFSKENLYDQVANTIWTGRTETYTVKANKGEIIEGEGQITKRSEKNSVREYQVEAKTGIRMIDNTFYFPGWKVYVDGKPAEIEWQDVNYRGVITYKVPVGSHNIKVKFEETKVRLTSDLLSVVSIMMFAGVWMIKKRSGQTKSAIK